MKKARFPVGAVLVLLLICVTPSAAGKVYTWVDKNGTTRFTDYPPSLSQVNTNGEKKPQAQKVTAPNVELYITSWCPYCEQAQEYFRSRGISYVVYDIEKDKKAAARKSMLDKQNGVPFAVINGKLIHGFAPQLYKNALKQK